MRTSDSDAISKFKESGVSLTAHDLSITGRHLHYLSVGVDTLPTILFIHGSPGSWDAFEAYLLDSALRRRFRMISIDRPGFGYSDYGTGLHLSLQCDLIASFIDSISTGHPLYLVGHSLGGSIVPVLAAMRPGAVSAIVVLAGAVDPAMEPREKWRKAFIHAPLRYLLPGAFKPSNDELWYFKEDVFSIKQKLPEIKCPVYIVHAVNDELVDVGNVAFMKKNMTAALVRDTIFPAGNHFIPWNHKAYIIKALLELK
jgi:pimeloyl-ACP methyl ester carboxylesterase